MTFGRIQIKPFFAWYDMWIGAYWDRGKRRLYVCPVPFFGVYLQALPVCDFCGNRFQHGYTGRLRCCVKCEMFDDMYDHPGRGVQ